MDCDRNSVTERVSATQVASIGSGGDTDNHSLSVSNLPAELVSTFSGAELTAVDGRQTTSRSWCLDELAFEGIQQCSKGCLLSQSFLSLLLPCCSRQLRRHQDNLLTGRGFTTTHTFTIRTLSRSRRLTIICITDTILRCEFRFTTPAGTTSTRQRSPTILGITSFLTSSETSRGC